ncbi:hypothetical protein ACFO4E_04675 [Nocardiopsis mangrovi]|uniref:Uncharacterized protein n=1 Tax=Nocardiopsis mangrovi TaxID=1179818 RepID=A0ABV9DU60_9ACTN
MTHDDPPAPGPTPASPRTPATPDGTGPFSKGGAGAPYRDGSDTSDAADSRDDADDEAFMAVLRSDTAPVGAMPAAVRRAARAAFAMRRDDAVFADLRDDSLGTTPVGLRDAGALADAPRYVRFEGPGVAVSMEVTSVDDDRDLVGRVAPAGAHSVEVRSPRGTSCHDVDPDGTFLARGVPRGPVSLLVHRSGTAPATTRWLTL